MTFNETIDQLRAEIRELGNIISSPLTEKRHKAWAVRRLEVTRKQLENLNKEVGEVK